MRVELEDIEAVLRNASTPLRLGEIAGALTPPHSNEAESEAYRLRVSKLLRRAVKYSLIVPVPDETHRGTWTRYRIFTEADSPNITMLTKTRVLHPAIHDYLDALAVGEFVDADKVLNDVNGLREAHLTKREVFGVIRSHGGFVACKNSQNLKIYRKVKK